MNRPDPHETEPHCAAASWRAHLMRGDFKSLRSDLDRGGEALHPATSGLGSALRRVVRLDRVEVGVGACTLLLLIVAYLLSR